jgi:AcrR family transcriptional regulator
MTSEPAPTVRRAERKRAQQADEMRADIIDAAFAEFAERGYHATTIGDIAKRLGISSGSFYNYFKNKRDIVDHVLDMLMGQMLAALQAENAPEAAQDAEQYAAQALRIAGAVDAIFDADRRVPQILLFEATSIDPELTARVMELFDIAGHFGVAYLTNGVERGFLRPDLNIPATADAITGMILAVAIRSLRSNLAATERRTLREAVVATMLQGIMR